jgi:hypothetical protein
MKKTSLLSSLQKIFSPVIVFILLNAIAATVSAQVVSGAMKPKISNWESKQDRLVLDINFDNWNKRPAGVDVKGFRSRGVNIMIMDEKVFGKGNVAFAWGIGFSSQNFHTNAWYKESPSIDSSYFLPIPDSVKYDLYKLSLNYIDIPLELRFRTKANAKGKRLKLSAGFKLGFLINAHTKFDDGSTKYKEYHLKNIPDFHYGVYGRLGFGHIGVSYFYSLTKLFEDGNKGMAITPYSIGISFTP